MKKLIYLFTLSGLLFLASCQNNQTTSEAPEISEISNDIERVEPPNWWVGFENDKVQLLIKHPNIGAATASVSYPGVR